MWCILKLDCRPIAISTVIIDVQVSNHLINKTFLSLNEFLSALILLQSSVVKNYVWVSYGYV